MTIDELIATLTSIKEANREPDVPGFDPGTLDVRVQSCEGTFESELLEVDQANDVWLIVAEPNYEGLA